MNGVDVAGGGGPHGGRDTAMWLARASDLRTRRFLAEQDAHVAKAFPGDDTRDLERVLQHALSSRERVMPPVHREGWCYRYDASQGAWRRAAAPEAGASWGHWQRLPMLDTAVPLGVASDVELCPYPSTQSPPGARAMARGFRGGADASESFEVDLLRGRRVEGGLHVAESIHRLSWDGPDALLVSSRVRSAAGVMRWVVDRVCRGGRRAATTTRLHEFPPTSVAGVITRDPTASGIRYVSIEWLDHRRRVYRIGVPDGAQVRWGNVPIPDNVRLQLAGEQALLIPLGPWHVGGELVAHGAVLAVAVTDLMSGAAPPRVVYPPAAGSRLLHLACGRHYIVLAARDSDITRLVGVDVRTGERSELAHVDRSVSVRATPVDVADDSCADQFWVETAGPVDPPRLERIDVGASRRRRWLVEEGRATFRHEDFTVRVGRTSGQSAPPVEYTVIAPAGMALDGANPTVMSAYGGFDVPERIDYLDLTGPSWLDRSTSDGRRSVFVFAHVGRARTAGEKPWARLARSVDQLLDVADTLAHEGITTSERLGAMGSSHGGLLVMNAMLTRPAAFGGVVCRSAVLDLLSFPDLDGTTWIDEYGDPRIDSVREALAQLSPVHRIAEGVVYPPVLLWAAADDDRVSPAHSRRTAVRLQAVGAPAWYLESPSGGHDGLGTTSAGVRGLALTAAFFRRHLAGGDQPRNR